MASRRLFRRRRSSGDELSFGPRSAAMRNPEREVYYFRIRIAVATVFVLAAFITLLARLAWLQVVKQSFAYDRSTPSVFANLLAG